MASLNSAAKVKRRLFFLAPPAIIILSFLVFRLSLSSPFLYDDLLIVRDNPSMDILNWPSFFLENYWGVFHRAGGLYRPLTLVVLALTKKAAGADPAYFRLVNMLLHAICSILLFFLADDLSHVEGRHKDHKPPSALIFPILAASLFLFHPVHTEAICFAVGLADILAAMFCLGGFLFYLKGRTGKALNIPFFIAALLCFCLALLAKESAVVFPLLLVAFETLVLPRGEILKKNLTTLSIFLFPVPFYLLVRLAVLGRLGPSATGTVFQGVPFWLRLYTMAGVLAKYIGLMFFPYPLKAVYDIGPMSLPAASPIGLSIILLVLFLLIRRPSQWKLFTFGTAWFFVSLLPVSNIFPIGAVMAERFLYLPSAGFCLAMAFLLTKIMDQRSPFSLVITAGTITYLVALIFLTQMRTLDWQAEEGFWAREVRLSPVSAGAHNNLGRANHLAGEMSQAEKEYLEAYRLNPNFPEVQENLGLLHFETGDFQVAEIHFRRAISLNPDHFRPYLLLAKFSLAREDLPQARILLEKVLSLGYRSAEVYRLLGGSLAALGEYEAAEKMLRESLALESPAETHYALGNIHMATENYTEAAASFRRALAISPDHYRALNNLGITLVMEDRHAEAEMALRKASTLNPDWPQPLFNLGRLAEKKGDREKAASLYRQALKKDPSWKEVREALRRVTDEAGKGR